MEDSQEHGETPDDLRFFGLITASTTHELRNIVATIEQVTGLLEDHIAGLQVGQAPDPQRLSNLRERIARQILRARATIDRLNAFAHTVDESVCQFDLRELLVNLLGICERLANLRRIRLNSDLPSEGLLVRSQPFALQQAIFVCLRGFWEEAPEDSEVEIKLAPEDGGARIEITGPATAPYPTQDGSQERLATLMAAIAGNMDSRVTGNRRTFAFRLPASP